MSDYSFLMKSYPEVVSKDQLYRICHISKQTAKYYLDNGLIPCVASKKKRGAIKSRRKTLFRSWKTGMQTPQDIFSRSISIILF